MRRDKVAGAAPGAAAGSGATIGHANTDSYNVAQSQQQAHYSIAADDSSMNCEENIEYNMDECDKAGGGTAEKPQAHSVLV